MRRDSNLACTRVLSNSILVLFLVTFLIVIITHTMLSCSNNTKLQDIEPCDCSMKDGKEMCPSLEKIMSEQGQNQSYGASSKESSTDSSNSNSKNNDNGDNQGII